MIRRGKRVKLTNDFHNTETHVVPLVTGYVSPRAAKEAGNRLCGVPGCACSGTLGVRGRDNPPYDQDPDGSFMLFT